MKRAAVYGAGGFIGSHMVRRLKHEGYKVDGYDLKLPEFSETEADEFYCCDLRLRDEVYNAGYDELYQFAADMGGAGYIFTGEHDADVMHNSAQINLNVCDEFKGSKTRIFYSSSACMYPAYNQEDPNNPNCKEDSAYPAAPDSEYGWEKLFSERLYMAYRRNYELDVRIARFHNVYGVEGTYKGGKEKAPAALCRKVAEAKNWGNIEIWGDGEQTRSFLFIHDCIDGVRALMKSHCEVPVNIGSSEMVTINEMAKMVIEISGKKNIGLWHNPAHPQGVRGRNSENTLCERATGWRPGISLYDGLKITYDWVNKQVNG